MLLREDSGLSVFIRLTVLCWILFTRWC